MFTRCRATTRADSERRPESVKGDLTKRDALTSAMRQGHRRQPARQVHDLGRRQPVQDIYLREAKGNNNEYRSTRSRRSADPARGCKPLMSTN